MDAWTLFGSEGLLPVGEDGHHSFTVIDNQYSEAIKNSRGYLTQFTIPQGGNTFVANENGIVVGPEGLSIVNQTGVSRIVLQSTGSGWIHLLGSVSIHNSPAELVFVTPYKIDCNGCSFPGLSKVTFCTLPSSSPLPNYTLQNDPSSYCNSGDQTSKMYIGPKGLLSTSINLNSYTGKANVDGPVAVGELNLKANSEIENKSNVDADKVQITGSYIKQHGKIASNHLTSIKCSSGINNYGTIASSSQVELEGHHVYMHKDTKIEAGQQIKATLTNYINFEKGAEVKSYGTLTIEGPGGRLLEEGVRIYSAKMSTAGDANIKAKELTVTRGGSGTEIKKHEFAQGHSKLFENGDDDRTKASAQIHRCYTEEFVDKSEDESRFLVGGNLNYQGEQLNNHLSVFKVGGAINYIGAKPQISEYIVEIKKVGEFGSVSNKAHKDYAAWRIEVLQGLLQQHCGLDSKGQLEGSVSMVLNRIGQPIAEHASEVAQEIGFNNIQQVSLSGRTTDLSHNHHQKPFDDQRPVVHISQPVPIQQTAQPNAQASTEANNKWVRSEVTATVGNNVVFTQKQVNK